MDPERLRAFLEHVRRDSPYAAWLLFATTGMRRGEVTGLRWIDVDLEAGRGVAATAAGGRQPRGRRP